MRKRRISDKAFRETARRDYAEPSSDNVVIDDNAKVSRNDDGHAWVQAWVFVRVEDVS